MLNSTYFQWSVTSLDENSIKDVMNHESDTKVIFHMVDWCVNVG
jgi:hypothetical protein